MDGWMVEMEDEWLFPCECVSVCRRSSVCARDADGYSASCTCAEAGGRHLVSCCLNG